MITVWKFPLRERECSVAMSSTAKILHVGIDPAGGYPALWALLDPESPQENRTFLVAGTGHEVPQQSVHLGSMIDGLYVWHIFETTEKAVLAEMLRGFA